MIKVKFPDFKKLVTSKIERKEREAEASMEFEKTLIEERTSRGLDYERKRFKAVAKEIDPVGGKYSKSYARYRRKKGRNTSFINLSVTNKMMEALKTTTPRRENNRFIVGIGFSDNEQAKKMLGNHEQGRVFFKVSKKRIKEIRDRINKA